MPQHSRSSPRACCSLFSRFGRPRESTDCKVVSLPTKKVVVRQETDMRILRLFSPLLLSAILIAAGRQNAPPYTPKQSDRPIPIESDETGFRQIFDGGTLTGWEGN